MAMRVSLRLGWVAGFLLCVTQAHAADYTWTQATGGPYAWDTPVNWTGSGNPLNYPNAIDDSATLSLTSDTTWTLPTGGITLGSLTLSGNKIHTVQAETLTFDVTSGAATLTRMSNAGQADSISSAILLNDNLLANIGGGGALTLSGGIADGGAGKSLTKAGTGTLILSGTNTYSGVTNVAAGTLTLNRQTGSLSSSSALTFSGSGGFSLNNSGATGALAQNLGTLTFAAGEGTVTASRVAGQDLALTFAALAARTAGAVGNFVQGGGTNGATNGFVLTGTTINTMIDRGVFFNGGDYAWYDNAGFVRAVNYGSDSGTATTGSRSSLTSIAHQQTTGAILAQVGANFTTLKINGANNLTVADGAAVAVDGILKTGNNSATWSGGASLKTATAGAELVIRTEQLNDTLTISSPIQANGTNLLTKSGAGTLTLSGANTFSGGVTLLGGTLNINSTTALGAAGGTFTILGGTINNSTGGAITLANNNPQSWNGDFAFTGTQSLNLGTGAVAMGDNRQVSVNANTLTVGGAISDAGAGKGLAKQGAGTLTLTGVNTYSGATTVRGGTLVADTVSNANVLNSSSGLVFTGTGTFQFKGAASQTRSQILNGLTITVGAATVDANNSGTSTTLDLRGTGGTLGITRSLGATVDFKATAGTFGTTAVIQTAQANDVNTGIIGGWATVNTGADWAINNGSATMVAYTGYNTLSGAGPTLTSSQYTNHRITSGSTGNVTMAATGTIEANTLLINDATARTIDVRNGTTQDILRFGPVGGILTSGGSHIIGVSGTGTAGTITAGGATANNPGELIVNNAAGLTINSVITNNGTGAVALTKSGSSTLTVSAVNTYTGGTTLNAGTLSFGTTSATIGTGPLTINGGTITSANVQIATLNVSSITLNGSFIHGDHITDTNLGTGPVTLNTPITIRTSHGLTFGGTFSGFNPMDIAVDATGGSNGNFLAFTQGFTLRPNQIAASVYTSSSNAPTLFYNGPIGDGGNGYGFTATTAVAGGGSVVLTAANTFTGTLTINLNATVNLGNNAGTGSLSPIAPIVNNGTFTFNRTGTITQGTDFGLISGTGAVTKSASGTAILISANTYSGATTISTGTIQLGNGGTTGSLNPSSTITNNATLAVNRSNAVLQGTDLGLIAGTGAVTKSGAGTLTLNLPNTFTGSTTINAGKIALGHALALQSSAYVTTGSTGAIGLDVTGFATPTLGGLSGAVNLATAITGYGSVTGLTLNPQSSQTYSGVIADGAAGMTLTKIGASTQILSGANTYTGTTTILAGTLQIGGGSTTGSLSSSSAIVNNGTLTFSRTNTLTQGTDFAGVISGTGAVTQNGSGGTTIFTGANTYTGLTTISAGTLQLGSGGTAGSLSTSSVILNNATLAFNRSDNVVQGTDFSGAAITGTGGLTKLGAGTLTLNAVNTFTGNTAISAGQVVLGNALALQNSAYDTTGSTGTIGLDVNGNNTPTFGGLAGNVALATAITGYSNITSLTLNPQSGKTPSYSGVIANGSGSLTLTKTGAGTQTLTGANTYTGTTTVNGGTLVADTATNATVLSSSSGLTFTGTGTFQFKGLASQTRSQILNGLTLTAGAATVDANNSGTSTTLDLRGTGSPLGITRSAGTTVDFKATTGTFGTTAIIKTAQANANGIFGAWATVGGGANWAANSGTDDAVTAYAGYTDVALAGTIGDGAGTNVRINSGASGNISLAAATTNVNTLMQNIATAATIDAAGKTLRLGTSGGILVATGKQALTIGTAAGSGTLTAGGSAIDTAGELVLNNSSSNTLTVNSVIANNGTGVVSLTKSGTGAVTLATANTYTGGTILNQGTLTLGNATALGTGAITINGGTLSTTPAATLTNNNQILATADFALSGSINTGAGQLRISKPLTITGSGTVPNPITDSSGGSTLNALDVTWAVPSTTTTLTVSGGITLRTDQILNVNVAHVTDSLTFSGAIGQPSSTTYGLTIAGALNSGNLFFTGNNTYTGPTTILPGIMLILGNAGTSGSLSASSTIQNYGTLRFNRSDAITQGTQFGAITGTGGISVAGGGTVSMGNSNTYAGPTIIRSIGNTTLSVSKLADGGVPSSIGQSSNAASNLVLGDSSTNDGFSLKYVGSGDNTDRLFTLGADWGLNTHKIDASGTGALNFTNSGSIVFSGSVNQARSLTLTGTNTNTNTLAPKLSDNGTGALAVIKTGSGVWSLTNNNTYTGVTTISGGTLAVATLTNGGVAGPLGQASNARANLVLSGGTLSYTGATAATDRGFTLSGSSTVDVNTAATALTLGESSLGAFTLNVTGGTGSSLNLGALVLTGAATLNPTTASLTVASVASTGGGNFGLTLGGTATGNSLAGGIVTGTGAVTKSNTGVWTLSGASTYTGATTVSGGKLTIGTTGVINGTSGVSIGAGEFNYNSTTALTKNVTFTTTGGKLSGTGTITPSVTVTAGNTLSPGNSPGTLSFGSNLTLAGITNMELNGNATTSDYDKVNVSGALTYGGTLNISFLTAPTAAGIYTLFSGFSGQSNDFATVNLPAAPSGFAWFDYGTGDYFDNSTGQVQLLSTGPVPAGSGTWKNGAGDFVWTTNTGANNNWITGYPSAAGHIATFDTNATGGTILLNGDKTIGKLVLSNGTNSYTIGFLVGLDTINFDNTSGTGNAAVTNTVGTHTINAIVKTTSNSNLDITVTAGALTLAGGVDNGAGKVVTVTNNGTLNVDATSAVSNIDGTGTLTVATNVDVTANRVRQGTLTLNGSSGSTTGKLTINQSVSTPAAVGDPAMVSQVTTLNIANDAAGVVAAAPLTAYSSSQQAYYATLDLKNNDLIVTNGNLALITDEIRSGAIGTGSIVSPAWNGTGITSSYIASVSGTALGVMKNVANPTNNTGGPRYTIFDGQTLSGNEILVKHTWYGDLDLDGTLSSFDFALLDAGFAGTKQADGSYGWFFGDLNYDGHVDNGDYSMFSSGYAGYTTYNGGGVTLPEPSTLVLGLFGLVGLGAAFRRRAKRMHHQRRFRF